MPVEETLGKVSSTARFRKAKTCRSFEHREKLLAPLFSKLFIAFLSDYSSGIRLRCGFTGLSYHKVLSHTPQKTPYFVPHTSYQIMKNDENSKNSSKPSKILLQYFTE